MKCHGYLAILALCCSCGGTVTEQKREIVTGEKVIASDSMRIAEDDLNEFYFRVILKTTAQKGSYRLDIAYGPNTGGATFTMPRGAEETVPEMKRGAEPYTYVIGFRAGKDRAFHEYYLVRGGRHRTEVRPLKAYRVE